MDGFIPQERDPKWSAFNDHSWESFQETYLPNVDLIPTVHEEVKKQYRAIRKLIAYSYFEYEFFDIAASQMAMLMEMAMVWKYEQVTGEKWKKKTKKKEPKRDLKNLFNWLIENGYLDKIAPIDTELLRNTRNYYAHPQRHGFAGGSHKMRITELIFFINELYDLNVKTSNVLGEDIVKWLNRNRQLRKVLRIPGHIFPLAEIALAGIDCSTQIPNYFFVGFPLFDLSQIDDQSPYAQKTMMVHQIVDLVVCDQYMSGKHLPSENEIRIEVADSDGTLFIDQWHHDLSKRSHLAAQLPMWRIVELQDFFVQRKTEYYRGFSWR
ncbi:MAG TPA: hypothetical protein VK508_21630 [Cyclobacteriaceae bacterium]|nr:hypothetical protein [Cyclobacteriaceae bacterium]